MDMTAANEYNGAVRRHGVLNDIEFELREFAS